MEVSFKKLTFKLPNGVEIFSNTVYSLYLEESFEIDLLLLHLYSKTIDILNP